MPTTDLVDLIDWCGERPLMGGLFLLSQGSTTTPMTNLVYSAIMEVAGSMWAGACRCKKVENGVAAMNSKQLSCNIATRAAPSIVKGE
jgi:hypothetical protein